MIRVLHNIGSLANGGMESFILNLYHHIDTSKIQFDFVVGTKNSWCEAYAEDIRRRGGRIFLLSGGLVSQVRQFQNILRQHPEYQIIHSHRDANSVFFLSAAKLTGGGRILISHSHSASETGAFKRLATIALRPFLCRLSTMRMACGSMAGEHLFKGFAYTVFPNAIDLDKYKYDCAKAETQRGKLGLTATDVVIGHVGRFEHQKNHQFLIDIFYHVSLKVPTAKLLLIGNGSLKEKAIGRVNDLGLADKVIFLEQRSDVDQLLQAMDLVVFPSRYEGFSMAMVEMQAAGLHILSSDKVPPEINVTGGVTFKSLDGSAEEWADETLRMLGYDRNNNALKKLYDYGLDINDSVRKIQALYISLLDEKLMKGNV